MSAYIKAQQVINIETPFLFIDKDILKENIIRFKKSFQNNPIYYSVKANSTREILSILAKESLNFDVASWEEIKLLKEIDISPKRIVFSAPTKLPRDIKKAHDFGVKTYAFDSKMELEKLSHFAPRSKVIGRLIVENTGSEWPLVRKFGLTNTEMLDFMPLAQKMGLIPYGLSFHVGSQNLQPGTWQKALEKTHRIWKGLKRKNITIPIINIGGGFPIQYTKKNVPDIEKIAQAISETTQNLFGDKITLFLEPGRRMVGNAGILVASVINRTSRGRTEWLYLDTGVYHGFQETLEGFRYTVKTVKNAVKKQSFILCGPTCDSTDIIMEKVLLPENITLGDKIYFLSCGAYSTSYEYYNGFRYPNTIIS